MSTRPDAARADVLVVGAGWAGLSAALHLTQAGRRVHLVESAAVPGGRAREVRLDLGFGPLTLDAGQHLLVGAYRESLQLAQRLHAGAAPFDRFPLALRDTAGLRLAAVPLPAPLHLAGALALARGLGPGGRLAAVRLLAGLRRAGWQVLPGETVAALLARLRQPPALIERLWSPLCVAALNTAAEAACANAFAAVLRDTLGADRGAADFVLPRATLAALIAHPAAAWLAAHGATLSWRTTARAIAACPGGWRVHTGADAPLEAAQLVLAVPARNAARLLAPLTPRATPLARFVEDPIATVYLAWPAAQVPRLPRWIMLRESIERGEHGQWLFDRGCLQGHRLAAAVISTGGRLGDATPAALAEGVVRQLGAQLGLPAPSGARTVVEKRATLRCTPQRPRVDADLVAADLPGIWLAGDYAYPDYPATLEGAVRSGRIAAERALGFAAQRTNALHTVPRSFAEQGGAPKTVL
ncbi:MAG: FAD-dependent oxidoreductase [Burkholderiales bacterium]|nr:FAD-dependent oxidoreductase [Burkholderiales bacterium]OJX05959.1 MAG: hypothetical protein BGO72_04685 [Burkholderiales bacterium 70-64]